MKYENIYIVSSAYNSEDEIEKFINSLIRQTYKNWKLVITDDGSTDNTYKILEKFKRIEKRIDIRKNNENMGLTYSLISMIKSIPKNTYLIRLDTDELHNSNYIEIIVKNIKKYNLDVQLYTPNNFYSIFIQKISPLFKGIFVALWGNIFLHGSCSFSKNLYEEVGGYERYMTYSQDHILWTKLLMKSKNSLVTSIKCFRIEQQLNKNSISKERSIEQSIFSIFAIKALFNKNYNNNGFQYKFILWTLIIISITIKTIRHTLKI
tara:strand:+ start:10122 stop:10913 length:792 start_codon:yes stop_codon:yes gene_type:complete